MNDYFKKIIKTKIPSNDIDIVTLLSTEEAAKLPEKYLNAELSWWLLDATPETNGTQANIHFRDNAFSNKVVNEVLGVRPALIIKNFDFSDAKIGDIFECIGKKWYYAGKESGSDEDLILCANIVGKHCFNKSLDTVRPNDFYSSDLYDELDHWLEDETNKALKYSAYFLLSKVVMESNDFDTLKSNIKITLEDDEDAEDEEILIINNVNGKYKIIF